MKYKHEDGNPFTKEEFLQKLKTDKEFNDEFGNKGIDQIKNLIDTLKTNPDSRRLMVSAWNVGELDQMVLPPCHYGFQVYTRELSTHERYVIARSQSAKYKCPKWDTIDIDANGNPILRYSYTRDEHYDKYGIPKRAISLMWNQRSVDTPLGLPFNISSYGLLLLMLADEVNMVPDELIGNLGDTHIYVNQIEGVKEQIGRSYTYDERTDMLIEAMGYEKYTKAYNETFPFGGGMNEFFKLYKIPERTREPYPLPTVHVRDGIYCSSIDDVILKNYQSHPKIEFPLSN